MSVTSRRRLGWILAAIFGLAMLLGPGPGMLLINEPRSFLGIPQLYAWGLLWYVVEVAVVVAAYLWVWPRQQRASGQEGLGAGSEAKDAG